MAKKNGSAGRNGSNLQSSTGEEKTIGQIQAGLYDKLLNEYGGYTLKKIEEELSWEQIFMITDAMVDRYEQKANRSNQRSGNYSSGNTRVRDYTLEEVIKGEAPEGLAGMVVKKQKKGSED